MKLNTNSLTDYVNPLQGTDSLHDFSCGNTLPLTGVPFGFINFCPQTSTEPSWFFNSNRRKLWSVRATHQPSPWISDYGQLGFLPVSGKTRLDRGQIASVFHNLVSKPEYLSVETYGHRAKLELTPVSHGCAMRLTYADTEGAGLDIFNEGGVTEFDTDCAAGTLTGWTNAAQGGVPEGFREYFWVKCDVPFDGAKTVRFQNGHIHLHFAEGCPPTVNVKVAFSYISAVQAEYNALTELGELDFDSLRTDAAAKWNKRLSAIEVYSSDEHAEQDYKTFYTCMYRCFMFPHIMHESLPDGSVQHYSPYDGRIHNGVLYTDHGFWDTAKTTYPLYAILCPDDYADMLDGWLNAYDEYGVLPKWPSPGERSCMPGTLIDSLFGEAVVKGIPLDTDRALKALLAHADSAGPAPGSGRHGGDLYNKYGYLPEDLVERESVAATLDYMYGDYCIALVAEAAGDAAQAKRLRARAGGYKRLYDPEYGIIRGMNSDGTRRTGFDPYEWGMEYCEGGAYQCGFSVYHDIDGLAELYGKDKLSELLSELENLPPIIGNGSYGAEIHEESEMCAGGFGQINIGNQPGFHVPYIFAAIGYPEKTQRMIRKVMRRLFSDKPDGFPGDEDNGSMAGYFIFSSLGFYPLCPSKPEYVIGSPLFENAVVRLPGGKTFTVSAPANREDTPAVSAVKVNGEALENSVLRHESVISGGILQFEMKK